MSNQNVFKDNPIGYVTFMRTYSRDKGKFKETYDDAVERWIKACDTQLHCGFTVEEEDRLRYYFKTFRGLMAGRFLWQLGTPIVDKFGLTSLMNCSALAANDLNTQMYWSVMMASLGVGLGVNIMREFVYENPKVVKKIKVTHIDSFDVDYVVPDNREGYATLFQKVTNASLLNGESFTYTTKAIRPKGSPVKSFGGTASGASYLIEGIADLVTIYNRRVGKKLRDVDVADIFNILGYVIVSANLRSSAEILLGDYDSEGFLNLKRWDLGTLPKWRSMSNNTVVCRDINKLPESFWDGYQGKGEPYGLLNLHKCQTEGRHNEVRDFSLITSINPCS